MAAVTITSDGWEADYWFGSLDTLADAADAAIKELSANGQPARVDVVVNYEGGRQEFDAIAEFRSAIPALLKKQINTIRIGLRDPVTGFSASIITSSVLTGVRVSVDGPRPALVYGLKTTLQEILEPGEKRVRWPKPLPPTIGDWAVGAMALVTFAGALLLGYAMLTDDFVVGAVIVWAVALGLIPLVVQLFRDRIHPSPPAITLVPVSQETAPPSQETEPTGPVFKAQMWVRKHPIAALLGTLGISVLGSLIAAALLGDL